MTTSQQAKQLPAFSGNVLQRYIYALRPWSWTASIIPILVTSSLTAVDRGEEDGSDGNVSSLLTFRLIFLTLCIQAAANAINTCEDFDNGVDKCEYAGGDRALVDQIVCPKKLKVLGYALLSVGVAAAWPLLTQWKEVTGFTDVDFEDDVKFAAAALFAAGVTIAVMYTAPPLRLKYHALGDVAVFLCFGPILMNFIGIVLTGKIQKDILNLPVVLPIGLLTVAILHGNNTRDIENDSRAGIHTLAVMLGFRICRLMYFLIIISSYGAIMYLAYEMFIGLILVFVTIPISVGLCKDFTPEKVYNADEETAKFHMLFGILMSLGIRLTPYANDFIANLKN